MKHTAPPEGVLFLKRKGHKQHRRRKTVRFRVWFWGFFVFLTLVGGGYLGLEFYLKQTSTLRIQEEIVGNMESIIKALDEYHRVNGTYPPAFGMSKGGNRTLSWRVLILPYFLDDNGNPKYQDLYDSFNLEEPWNHRDNLGLVERMPHEYRSPQSIHRMNDEKAVGLTNYLTVRNPHSVFPEELTPISKARITDPLDETVTVIEVNDDAAVQWTKPDDFEFNPLNPTAAGPRTFQPNVLVCGVCSGKVRVFPVAASVEALFQIRPKLPNEELTEKNPWVKIFLRDNDSPKLPESTKTTETKEETTQATEMTEMEEGNSKTTEEDEEYRPGRKVE